MAREKALILAGAALAAILASAAAATAGDAPPIARRSAVGIDSSYWGSSGSTFVLQPFAHYEVLPGAFIDGDFAFAPATSVSKPKTRFGLGNPMLGAHHARTVVDGMLTWFFGARLGIPLATLGDGASDAADLAASSANAYYDSFHWSPSHFPFVGSLGIEVRPVRGLWLRIPIEPIVLIPLETQYKLHGGAQARFEIEGRAPNGAGAGAALQTVIGNLFPSRNTINKDRAQMSSEQFFSFDNGTFLMRLGVLFSLSDPLQPGGVVTGRLQLGFHLK